MKCHFKQLLQVKAVLLLAQMKLSQMNITEKKTEDKAR